MLRLAEGVTRSRITGRNRLVEIIRLGITPTANRNSYRVARLVGVLTQGSVLRPQPWAGESQIRQSCCCLGKPLPMPSPKGGSSILLCLRWLCGAPSPWGRLGWGFGWGLFSCFFHPGAWGEALKSCKSFCVILPLSFILRDNDFGAVLITSAGSYHLIRGLVPIEPWARDL